MEHNKFMQKISHAQNTLNNLLIQARNKGLGVKITENKTRCFKEDDAVAVGLVITDKNPIYTSDGVP